jgi:16S rRNA (guanine527-N7)-methyltransferase
MSNAFKLLKETVAALDITASKEQLLKLYSYCTEIIAYNQKVNLTGSDSVETFIKGPLFDALTLLTVFEHGKSLVDIGSGGGLPGIPVAILSPSTPVTLVEPRSKRVEFLNYVTQKLLLNIEILHTQDRELLPASFDSAVAQAVFSPLKWIKRGKKQIKKEGSVYVLSSILIKPSDIVSDSSIEKQKKLIRPADKAVKIATRLRFKKKI